MFMSAALTDLGQEMKSSDAGIHSANMGGVWQDVVMGFGGIRIHDGHLRIRPNCPKQWEKFTYPLYWKGNELDVTVCKDGVEVINEGHRFRGRDHGTDSNCQQKEKTNFGHKNIGERKMLQKDGKFVKVLNRIADLVGLNLLAILFCIPIVTIGASITAVYGCIFRIQEKKRRISDKGFLEVV